jgi:hypothetical protein
MPATALMRRIGAPDSARCSVLERGELLQREISCESPLGARVVRLDGFGATASAMQQFCTRGCSRAMILLPSVPENRLAKGLVDLRYSLAGRAAIVATPLSE